MENIGFFRGTTLMQTSGNIGGARSVFVKLKGIKNDLVYPTFGGMLMNPPKGNGFKFYAGDLFYFDFDEKGHNPVLYLLKTYKVVSVSGSVVNIVKSEYSHKPFVGDKLGVAPSEIGGEMTAATITKVEVTKVGNQEVWACTMSSALSASANEISLLLFARVSSELNIIFNALAASVDILSVYDITMLPPAKILRASSSSSFATSVVISVF
jgi:hypothetical protein